MDLSITLTPNTPIGVPYLEERAQLVLTQSLAWAVYQPVPF